MNSIDNLFIVGAGFSSNAGLPLTAKFTRELLNLKGLRIDGPSAHMVSLLRKFVSDTFDAHDEHGQRWPELEDVFTCVDLAANTGHHLGGSYSPSDLRTIRRALIVRTIRMLALASERGEKQRDDQWKRLHSFFTRIDSNKSAFLSLNWDTIIEEGISRSQGINKFDYGCEALAARFAQGEVTRSLLRSNAKTLSVLKPHGSINWLYCDSCRHLFWFPPEQTPRIAVQLFKPADWERVSNLTGRRYTQKITQFACPGCDAVALGTRFATFSYRKALDFPMHERSWLSAERLLRRAKNWIFIGYSLPAADYEFKYLLKRVQLSRSGSPPDLVLVTGGSSADATIDNYRKFFGRKFAGAQQSVFSNGLDDSVMYRLSRRGVLSSRPLS